MSACRYAETCSRTFVTCRRRKVKCDEALPVCLNCKRVQKECLRPNKALKYILHYADSQHQKSLIEYQGSQNDIAQEQEQANNDLSEAKYLVSSSPKLALENVVLATLFRHYIDFLAPWYDLNDSQSLFSTLVPQQSLSNQILFTAVIAFSACHQSRISTRYQDLGPAYHAACVRDLLEVMLDIRPEMQGDCLAATCLLRSYEILNGDTRQQQHLLGAYSFASTSPTNLGVRGLSQSGTWNYLREEITMALELRRAVRIGTFDFLPSEMDDDMWANYISYILARIINFCFDDNSEVSLEEKNEIWQGLKVEVFEWRARRPRSFDPFSTAKKAGNVFPSLWMVRPWHVAGEQYCSVAEILLALSKPHSDIPQIGLEQSQGNIQDHALKVCGLAFTNENIAARVNAFGPLAFCGRYLVQRSHREALVSMLLEFSIPTGWPVRPIIEDLRRVWASEEQTL